MIAGRVGRRRVQLSRWNTKWASRKATTRRHDHKPPTTASTGRDRENVTRTRALTSRRDQEGGVKPVSFAWKRACVLPSGAMPGHALRSPGLVDAGALRRFFLAVRFPAPWLSNSRSVRLLLA